MPSAPATSTSLTKAGKSSWESSARPWTSVPKTWTSFGSRSNGWRRARRENCRRRQNRAWPTAIPTASRPQHLTRSRVWRNRFRWATRLLSEHFSTIYSGGGEISRCVKTNFPSSTFSPSDAITYYRSWWHRTPRTDFRPSRGQFPVLSSSLVPELRKFPDPATASSGWSPNPWNCISIRFCGIP